MRKKRIFAPRRDERHLRLTVSLALILMTSASAFSAGYYVGIHQSREVLAATHMPLPLASAP